MVNSHSLSTDRLAMIPSTLKKPTSHIFGTVQSAEHNWPSGTEIIKPNIKAGFEPSIVAIGMFKLYRASKVRGL